MTWPHNRLFRHTGRGTGIGAKGPPATTPVPSALVILDISLMVPVPLLPQVISSIPQHTVDRVHLRAKSKAGPSPSIPMVGLLEEMIPGGDLWYIPTIVTQGLVIGKEHLDLFMMNLFMFTWTSIASGLVNRKEVDADSFNVSFGEWFCHVLRMTTQDRGDQQALSGFSNEIKEVVELGWDDRYPVCEGDVVRAPFIQGYQVLNV
ncbi:hypothetical protein EDC04DRAFT_2612775 [Pisolithus marmoratus]|nr:hypothetical protein EDC04DRAFT_2612775 [Pisolithus marmoratus]